jgi:hypothetical protein
MSHEAHKATSPEVITTDSRGRGDIARVPASESIEVEDVREIVFL